MIGFFKKIYHTYKYKKQVLEHIKDSPYATTLYCQSWLFENHDRIMEALPQSWMHEDNFDYIQFGLKMKLLDVPWDDYEELKGIFGYLEMIEFIQRKQRYQVARNLDSPFNPTPTN